MEYEKAASIKRSKIKYFRQMFALTSARSTKTKKRYLRDEHEVI